MQVLGVLFNNKGVSEKNKENVKNKIKQALYLWNVSHLNMLERVIVCKTFILSKLWFLACFIKLDNKFAREINSLIYNFIWNNNKECIKRDTLIIPYERGGMNMFNLYAKLKTISFQQFRYIYYNFERDLYCMIYIIKSVYQVCKNYYNDILTNIHK